MSEFDDREAGNADVPQDTRTGERRTTTPVEGHHGLVTASINVESTGPQLEASVTRDPIMGGGYMEFVTFDVKGGGVDFNFSMSPDDAREFANELLDAVDETIPAETTEAGK